jgi:hypothetical protein
MAGNNRQTSSNKMSKFNWTNELVNDLMIYGRTFSRSILNVSSIKVFRKIGWSSIPSKSVKVFDAGLHGQKTLTKFLMENFDRVNGALHIT